MVRIAGIAFVTLTALALVAVVASSLGLPDPVSLGFGAKGRGGVLVSRDVYMTSIAALVTLGPAVVFASSGWAPKRWTCLVNIPHKAYWFAPERREQTEAALAMLGLALAAVALASIVYLHVIVVDVNEAVPVLVEPWRSRGLAWFDTVAVGAIAGATWLRFRRARIR